MENTTIALPKDLKKKIEEFGKKGEKFSDIVERLLKSAENRQLEELLFNEENSVSIDKAKEELNKKWPKSK